MKITEILKYVETNKNSAFFYTPNIYKEGRSYFLKYPYKILRGRTKDEIKRVFDEADDLIKEENLLGFAAVPYEIGYYFQPKKIRDSYLGNSELKFIFYERKNTEVFKDDELSFEGVEDCLKELKPLSNLNLGIEKDDYIRKIAAIKEYIREGDTYQINFTSKAEFNFEGDVVPLFLSGIFNQSARYSALINAESEYVFSFSPELFFCTNYKIIYSRPMKGTVTRKGDPQQDKLLTDMLLDDDKTLAENVMIVDLLRNDIGRIAETDSVKVEKLYEIEKYETLYQLTSLISGKLKTDKLSEIFENLFPSGSITGAPKIRSMQIIAELETSPRNLYTGAIGLLTNERAVFNIPIRTLKIDKSTKKGEIGLGSGIVWDSSPEKEYEEVLLKGRFINASPVYFELLETMLFEKGEYFLLDYHIQRLSKAADYFLFKLDKEKLLEKLKDLSGKFEINKKYKIRLLLTKWGEVKIASEEIVEIKKKMRVALSRAERCSISKFLFHKTTYRPWDALLKSVSYHGFDEVLFCNREGEILEGAISNLLIEKNGELFTTPVDLAILNGCYRQHLLDKKICRENRITLDDLKNADRIFLINSVKKEMPVSEVFDESGIRLFSANVK